MIRICDILLSLSILLFLSPLLLLTALILRVSGEGEVFYLQCRVGRNEKNFKLYKFATMLKNSASMGTGTLTIQNDPRVLPIGKLLRKTKFNELPQLYNVLIGDMSLIGPRPLTPNMYEFYSSEIQRYISSVQPGVSGIGSVIFRDEEKLLIGKEDPMKFYSSVIAPYKGEVEKWFVVNRNFYLYCKLILATIVAVFFPRSQIIFSMFPNLPNLNRELSSLF